MTAYFGSIETRTDPSSYYWDGMKRLGRTDTPLFAFQITLAGWGRFPTLRATTSTGPAGHGVHRVDAVATPLLSARGFTRLDVGWISIYHPYLLARLTAQLAATGPVVDLAPDGPLAAIAMRLMRGAIKKDFRDRFEVELALFEFLVAYEQCAQGTRDNSREGQRLLETVRSRVVASLPNSVDVNALAAEHGMSRTHFSHFFRALTGLTPARSPRRCESTAPRACCSRHARR